MKIEKSKKDRFIEIAIAVISISVICLVSYLFLNNEGKFNQGMFKVNDMAIRSSIEVKENLESSDITSFEDFSVNLSLNNYINIYIGKLSDTKIQKIYIDNIKCSKNSETYIFQNNDDKILVNDKTIIELNTEEKDDSYYISFNFLNENCIKNAKFTEDIKVITYDGTILNKIGKTNQDIYSEYEFTLNILDSNSRINKCKMTVYAPSEKLVTDGIDIRKVDVSSFAFKLN